MRKNTWLWIALAIVAAGVLVFLLLKAGQPRAPVSGPATSPAPTLSPHSTETDLSEPAAYEPGLSDCFQARLLYFPADAELGIDCTANYLHFYPRRPAALPASGNFEIAAFNLYRLGETGTALKQLPLLARIINQWDLVSAEELMPLNRAAAKQNQREYARLRRSGEQRPGGYLVEPAQLSLLKELRRLNPSWALLMQPRAEGEGGGELAGFYYRASRVQPKPFGYCPAPGTKPNVACLTQVGPEQRALMSRRGFVASFRAGAFDFLAVAAHVRFHGGTAAEGQRQSRELCRASSGARCRFAKAEVGRFYEVAAIAAELKRASTSAGETDVILLGDFNLEEKAAKADDWNTALAAYPGLQVFQTGLSTLSEKKGQLASNYDHFLLDPREVTECDPRTARVYDFTRAYLNHPDPILAELARLGTPEGRTALLAERKRRALSLAGPGPVTSARRPSEESPAQKLWQAAEAAVKRMKLSSFHAYKELLSDHLPIHMTCRAGVGPK